MTYAVVHKYCILTNDRDFAEGLFTSKSGRPSVVHLRLKDVTPETAGFQVMNVIRLNQQLLDDGALITVQPERSRLRTLPLL